MRKDKLRVAAQGTAHFSVETETVVAAVKSDLKEIPVCCTGQGHGRE